MQCPSNQLEPIAPGTEVGNYRILRELDIDAGLSRSYLAKHRLFERRVVISHVNYGSRTLERFSEWLRVMERLRHPRVIGLLDCGDHDGFPYAVLEHVEGRTLDKILRDGQRLDCLATLRLFSLLADALAHCHANDIAHRDLKPEHVIISSDGVPFLKGFEGASRVHAAVRTGGFCWTPDYAPPEIWRCVQGILDGIPEQEPMNFAVCDVWSFGLMMYRTLTRHDHVEGASFDGMRAFFQSPLPLPLDALGPLVASPIRDFVARCVRKDPRHRYRDGSALAGALDGMLTHFAAAELPAGAPISVTVGRGLLLFTEPLSPSSSGKYLELRVVESIGTGGFADVMRVERILPENFDASPMALKVLRRDSILDERAAERFRREAMFLARVSHPNVVRLYAFGKLGPTFFILEELLPGPSLRQWLHGRQPLTIAEITRIARQVTSGLSALHRAGLVHRDLKPDNLVLGSADARIVIVDLGIAHAHDVTEFTETGAFVGTAAYAAPEQFFGKAPTVETDLYALGVILFELIAGRRPYQAASLPALMRAKNTEDAPDVRDFRPDLPEALAGVVMRLLAREPDRRPGSARDVATLLGEDHDPAGSREPFEEASACFWPGRSIDSSTAETAPTETHQLEADAALGRR